MSSGAINRAFSKIKPITPRKLHTNFLETVASEQAWAAVVNRFYEQPGKVEVSIIRVSTYPTNLSNDVNTYSRRKLGEKHFLTVSNPPIKWLLFYLDAHYHYLVFIIFLIITNPTRLLYSCYINIFAHPASFFKMLIRVLRSVTKRKYSRLQILKNQ